MKQLVAEQVGTATREILRPAEKRGASGWRQLM